MPNLEITFYGKDRGYSLQGEICELSELKGFSLWVEGVKKLTYRKRVGEKGNKTFIIEEGG